MPHSSGGGSHSSGSHSGGGSSSSSSSSGGSSIRYHTSSTYFPGARRYVRYKKGQPEYIYSDDIHLNEKPSPLRFLLLIIYVPFIIAVISMFLGSINIPHQITEKYPNPVTIEDNLDVFNENTALADALYQFYKTTGIPVTIITENNDWMEHYDALDVYAYDLYVDRYIDEDHWVIVYTTDFDETFEDWHFEGMQGYNTDSILTTSVTDKFNVNLTRYLMNSGYSKAEAFTQAFKDITPGIMTVAINKSQLGFALVFCVFVTVHMTMMIRGLSNRKYKNYVKCPDDNIADPHEREARCEYCGGIYYIGTVTSCPHCGAPLSHNIS